MLGRSELRGPWAGLPVAWKEDWSFDEEVYRANVERTCKAGVPGIYTGGTTGEFYAMEFDEFQQITRATVEECKRWHTPVMIGVTSTYTLGAQRRAAYAEGLGADAVQLAMPYWMESMIASWSASVLTSARSARVFPYVSMIRCAVRNVPRLKSIERSLKQFLPIVRLRRTQEPWVVLRKAVVPSANS